MSNTSTKEDRSDSLLRSFFYALHGIGEQGVETTKFIAMDKDENSRIQIIQTKNARIDEINTRFDGK